MSLKITSNQSGFGAYVTYRAKSMNASGLFLKSQIRVAGIPVGRIIKIELQENQALITFQVRKDVPITEGSKLRIKSAGLLGDKYPEILIGTSTKVLPEGAILPAEESGGMQNIVQDSSEILADVKSIVRSIKASLLPENSVAPIEEILQKIRILVDNTTQATEIVRDIASNSQERIDNMILNLEKFAMILEYQMNKTNNDSAMADVNEILHNVKDMTQDLKKIVFDLKSGKGTIGKFLREDKIADEVTETLSGMNKLVNKVNMIRAELDMFMGSNTSYGADGHLNLQLHPSPERFYLLGLATSEYGVDKKKRIIRNIDGDKTIEDETIRDKDTLRFNFQLGRQYNNWVFRGGLIESTGGLGFDYKFPKWDQKISLELFDFRENIGPNLRPSSEFRLWNMFYGRVALEDILVKSRSATFSVGLRFIDEDIRSLAAFFIK